MDTKLTAHRVPRPGEWVTLAEACRLTDEGKGVWYRRATHEAEAARSVGRSARAIKAPLGGGSPRVAWWIRRDCDERLALDLDAQVCRDNARSFPCSEAQLQRARRRARRVVEWRKACDGQPKGKRIKGALARQIVRQAKRTEGAEFRVSVRSLQIWWRRYAALGREGGIAGLSGLIDGFGGMQ